MALLPASLTTCVVNSLTDCFDLSLVYVRTTFAPRHARFQAIALPIPRDAPVTIALSSVLVKFHQLTELHRTNTLPSSVRGSLGDGIAMYEMQVLVLADESLILASIVIE